MSHERQGMPLPAPPGNQMTLLVLLKLPARIQVCGWVLQTPPVSPSMLSLEQGTEKEAFLKDLVCPNLWGSPFHLTTSQGWFRHGMWNSRASSKTHDSEGTWAVTPGDSPGSVCRTGPTNESQLCSRNLMF